MATSVSVRPPTNPLHHSLSLDDQDQYYGTTNDDALCMEYLNEITPGHKSQSKYLYLIFIFLYYIYYSRDGIYRLQTDQQQYQHVLHQLQQNLICHLIFKNYLIQILFKQCSPPSSSAQQRRQRRRRRRRSTSVARTRDELLDSAYQPSNVDHLDLTSFFGNSNHSFYRPTSAPTRTYFSLNLY